MIHLYSFELDTATKGLFDITETVKKYVRESKVRDGICLVYCPHTTASITINENADEEVGKDITYAMNEVFPQFSAFKHNEGNSDCHVKCSVMGASETLIITEGDVLLGRWQGIYLSEFDPPRHRTVYIKIMEG